MIFWSHVDRSDSDACWPYQLKPMSNGYVVVTVFGRKVLAHRYSYELLVGSIPEGKQIDHLCRSKSCVNPAHMEPVTQRENLLRADGWPGVNHRKTHCKHGHEFTSENTRYRLGRGRECRICARRHDRAKKRRRREAVVR